MSARRAARVQPGAPRRAGDLALARRISIRAVRTATGWCAVGCRAWSRRWLDGATSAPRQVVAAAALAAADAGDQHGRELAALLGAGPAPQA
jgi:hypothetical protein